MSFQHKDSTIKKRSVDGVTTNIQVCECKYCGRQLEFTAHNGVMHSDALKKKLSQKKWRYHEKGEHTCRPCITKFKARAKQRSMQKTCETKEPPSPNTQLADQLKDKIKETSDMATTEISVDATTIRALMGALIQHIDQATGMYKSGVNDAQIAASLNLDVAIIEKERTKLYGDLYEKAKKDGAHKLMKDHEQAKADFTKFSENVMKLMGQFEEKMQKLEADIKALKF